MLAMNKWQIICPLVVIGAAALFGLYCWHDYGERGSRAMQSACLNNPMQIDGAKKMWADHHHSTTNEVPTWGDLVGSYLKERRSCPAGGTYTIGRVGEKPKCSIESHKLAP